MRDKASETFSRIRLKVLAGFGLILIIVFIAGYIHVDSLKRLENAVSDLSQPDNNLQHLRALLEHIRVGDDYLRSYAISGEPSHLVEYHRYGDSARQVLAFLSRKMASGNDALLLDSIRRLLALREDLIFRFSDQDTRNLGAVTSGFSSVAPPHDDQNLLHDTVAVKPAHDSSSDISGSKQEPARKSRWRGFLGWMGFGKEKPEETAPASAHLVPTNSPDTTAMHLERQKLEAQELKFQNEIKQFGSAVLEFLQKDHMILSSVQQQVSVLENSEYVVNEQRASQAQNAAYRSRTMMNGVALFGLLSTLSFSYLILIDVTRSNRLRKQLQEEQERTEHLAHVKEEFLASMSHEIRTPLNAIVGFAEQLARKTSDETVSQVKAIEKASHHLLSVVNQILDFSKIESGKWEYQKSVFNFRELIREVYDTLRIKAEEKNIYFNYSVEDAVPEEVEGYALSLKQILLNLGGNAIKFTVNGGVTMIGYVDPFRRDFHISVDVKDTGIGIPPDKLHLIFDKFSQSDSNIGRRYGGTGLGLAISRKLAEALGGSISVKSQEGVGSVFSMTLPFLAVDQRVPEKIKGATVGRSLKDYSVLIVDDEEMNIMLCESILQKTEIKIRTAGNGRNALAIMEQESIDLVLLDLRMPDISGREVSQRIRSLDEPVRRNVPLLALTADVFSKEVMKPDGFSDILTKPFKEDELLEKVYSLLLQVEPRKAGKEEKAHPIPGSSNGAVTESEPSLYSLKWLEQMSGSNAQFIRSMMESFVRSSAANMEALKEAASDGDWKRVADVAHRMRPAYKYFQVQHTLNDLLELESVSGEQEVPSGALKLVDRIVYATVALQEEMRKQLERLDDNTNPMSMRPEETVDHKFS